ncbi:MAG TPA: hypothetical protein VHS78_17475 [Candidatus Elarobacter sp.]|jgi:hypothetical protein|nr:hypothetical protein [Candidatus Elarobacter sp.]
MIGAIAWRRCAMVLLAAVAGAVAQPARADAPPGAGASSSAVTPQQAFAAVLERFRSRPQPPFVTYTLTRYQLTAAGAVDPTQSYVKRYWVRASDRAALTRFAPSATERGPLTFDRPAFNEPRDPGPPTYDFFRGVGENTYVAESATIEGAVVHLRLRPTSSPDANPVREVFADKDTYELRKIVAADKLFIERGPVYPVTMTITIAAVDGVPIIREVHGVVGGNYNDDGKEVDYTFSDVAFPVSLPDWYFDPHQYGAHAADAPV